ncbi:hypothetical protein LTR10_007445 [Elasticomyces elasticus]|uniref:Nudix hydrolase domain-containing protein n=1 Tax=Elasticomyces elasticus TaxID=574655 RepID=A0AAN7W9W5_9PEZI|nr:hypothetical protein LTR10_007445 [Elasticomyces elasticus]KAK4979255.1 hypothetical protein LTR42_001758 [Elasticomyces elasticus]KAK5704387.1 hypothetical protein LTR97_003405 [Elasticomyces elasticus]
MAQREDKDTYLSIVASCDDFPYDSSATAEYYKLYLPNDDQPHGYMLPDIVEQMPWTKNFTIYHDHPRSVTILDGSHGRDIASAINDAFAGLVNDCIDRKLFGSLDGRHSEPCTIVSAKYDQPVHVERFAAALFGLTQRGAHLVAYTNDAQVGMKLWIPRRSAHLYTYPGMLDTTVAGGIKSGSSPFLTIIEEAQEEASLPEMLVRQHARSRGAISHLSLTGKGFRGEQGLVVPDFIYVYDMELPFDVVPKPCDDEVGEFSCMSIEEVQATLLNGEFKPDSAAVLIDFLVRHSFIIPENEPDFVEISMRLHRRLPFRVLA